MARFCARRGIAASSLKWWRWRLRSEPSRSAPTKSEVRLLPVDVVGIPVVGPTTVAVSVGDVDVRVEVGVDVEYVAALVAALRSRC